MKKINLILLVFALMMALISGCAKNTTNESSSTQKPAAADPAASGDKTEPANTVKPAENVKPIVIKWMGPFTSADSAAAGSDKQTEATKQIIADYEKLHPNVKIELVNYVSSDWDQKEAYLKARFLAKDGPDIYQSGGDDFLGSNVSSKRWISLDDILKGDDPYVPGKTWEETFDPDALARSIGSDGKKYPLNITGLGVALFYNKDLFAQAGVVGEPKTLKELTDAYDKLKAAGITGLSFAMNANTPQLHWWTTVFLSQYWHNSYSPLDNIVKNGAITGDEAVVNTKLGTYPNYDWLVENYETMKKLTPYMPKGWEGNLDVDALFTQGKAATLVQTNAFIDTLIDAKVPFKYGTLTMPIVTKESAPNAPGVQIRHTGPWGIAVGLPVYLQEDKEKYATVIDFLKFFTSPENISTLAGTSHGIVPFVIGAKPSDGVEVFTDPSIPLNNVQSPITELGPVNGKRMVAAQADFMSGKLDAAQLKPLLKDIYDKSADEQIKINPSLQAIIDKLKK